MAGRRLGLVASLRLVLVAGERHGLVASVALLFAVVACQAETGSGSDVESITVSGFESVAGIVVSVESPALGRVDRFELLTPDGRTLAFDTTELEFDSDFPLAHVAEHQLLSDPITVTYHNDGNRLVVTKLDDGS